GELGRLIGLPAALRFEAETTSVDAAALVRDTVGRRRGPCGRHQLGDRETRLADGRLDGLQLTVAQRGAGRNGVLPDELLAGGLGPEIAGGRAHVTVGELEPGASEGVFEGLLIVLEPT